MSGCPLLVLVDPRWNLEISLFCFSFSSSLSLTSAQRQRSDLHTSSYFSMDKINFVKLTMCFLFSFETYFLSLSIVQNQVQYEHFRTKVNFTQSAIHLDMKLLHSLNCPISFSSLFCITSPSFSSLSVSSICCVHDFLFFCHIQ